MKASLPIIGLILMGTLAGCAGYNTGLVAQEWVTSYKLGNRQPDLKPRRGEKPGAGFMVWTTGPRQGG